MKKRRQSPFTIKSTEILSTFTVKDASKVFNAESWTRAISPMPALREELINAEAERRKAHLLLIGITVLFLLLFGKLAFLQINTGSQALALAEGNRIRSQVIYSKRGIIYDRNGTVLARNTASFQLVAIPYQLADSVSERVADYQLLGEALGISWREVRSRAEEQGVNYVLPVPIKKHISHEKAIIIEQVLPEVAGFTLDEVPLRQYVPDAGLSHVLGYVGQVSPDDLDENSDLSLVDFVGRSGIEQQYDHILRGENGFKQHEVDAVRRPVRLLAERSSINGTDITLTIDYQVQKQLYKAVKRFAKKEGNGKGAAVALDPRTGEVLALVSYPDYDNNLFAKGLSDNDFTALIHDRKQPLYNRAITGTYPTGSSIKPVVATAALEEGTITKSTTITDRGSLRLGKFVFRNYRGRVHGVINITEAIAKSSNVFFYTLGGGAGNIEGLGIKRMSSYFRQFGLGDVSGIDLPNESLGVVPDNAWKLEHKGEPWYPGDNYNIAIGQGDIRVSPLQLALANSAVANRGELLKPHLLKAVDGREESATVRRYLDIRQKNFDIVRQGMREAATYGTVCQCHFAGVPVSVSGKTGTAEISQDEDDPSHAWFFGFAPFRDPKISVTVLLEKGRSSSFAVQASAPAFEAFFRK